MSEQMQPIERRSEDRFDAKPLRVDVQSGPSGILLDLNYSGALMELPTPNEVHSDLAFDVCWEGNRVRLHGRVIRSTPCYDRHSRLTWGEPACYRVAVEFFDTPTPRSSALQALVRRLKTQALPSDE